MTGRENSPGLDLSHGFIHVIRRHQLTEAERLRELAATQANKKSAHKFSTPKVKRPDAPLYSRGTPLPTPQPSPQPSPKPQHSAAMLDTDSNQQEWVRAPLAEEAEVARVLEAADIDGFPRNSHDLLRTTIVDVRDVIDYMLAEVAELLVERAYKDQEYEEKAAIACAHIVQCEYVWQDPIGIPSYQFRRALQSQCMAVLEQWQDFGTTQIKASLQRERFCRFLQHAYLMIHPGGFKLESVLSGVMTRLLTLLLQDIKAGHVDRLSILVRIFQKCGTDLQATNRDDIQKMMPAIRDLLFHPDTQPHARHMLLQIIELQAAQFKPSIYC